MSLSKKVKYPRIRVSNTTLIKVKRMAKKNGLTISEMGNKLVIQGIKSLNS